ncbi:hypothetical protein SFR_4288 [Streptomyces sp. FR-008]|nr:hypothetical protein SFR_4288 [Streptomyces sp. FR-008]
MLCLPSCDLRHGGHQRLCDLHHLTKDHEVG